MRQSFIHRVYESHMDTDPRSVLLAEGGLGSQPRGSDLVCLNHFVKRALPMKMGFLMKIFSF